MITGLAGRSREGARAAAARGGAGPVILVIAEQRDGMLNRATWEAIAAAQQLAARRRRCSIAVLGRVRRRPWRRSWRPPASASVLAVDRPGARAVHPGWLRHRARAGDRVGVAAGRGAAAHVSDARLRADAGGAAERSRSSPTSPGSRAPDGEATFTRPMFQGKLAAEVKPAGNGACLVTFQIGAFRADARQEGRDRRRR